MSSLFNGFSAKILKSRKRMARVRNYRKINFKPIEKNKIQKNQFLSLIQ